MPRVRDGVCGGLKIVCGILLLLAATAISSSAQTLSTLHSFNLTDGAHPGGVTQATDGNLYGTTTDGGANGDGTVFKITTSGTLTTLHSFNISDGAHPSGVAQATDGNLYGTTTDGGANGDGTVFKITTGGILTTLYSFNISDGAHPGAGVVQGSDGNLYGSTVDGGANGDGSVFKITTGGVLTTLHSFNITDGSHPSGLAQAVDGNLYGTTVDGGANGDGSVYKITTGGTLTTLYSFNISDGAHPNAEVVQGADGSLYSTTVDGGASGDGTAFKITTGGTLTILHSFNITDGAHPQAGLVQGTDGNFYGATVDGGSSGDGTAFNVTTGGSLTTLHSFNLTDGAHPNASLVQGKDGKFYGTTVDGGASGDGTIFSLDMGFGNITLTPASLVFGSQNVGTTSATMISTLKNTGTAVITLTSFTASGDFAIASNNCGASLAGGATCQIGVTFTPTVVGARSGSVVIKDSGLNTPQTLTLTGTGVGVIGNITLSPGSLVFGNQATGTTSAAKTATLTNTGSASVNFNSFVKSGDFAIASNTCGATLAGGTSCQVGITFTPTVLGARSGSVVVTDNALNNPQTLSLTGTGVSPGTGNITLTPTSLAFGNQFLGTTSAAKTVTFKNTGTAAITFSSIVPSGDYAIASNTCGTSLAGNATCQIGVTFKPTVAGSRPGSVVVTSTALNSPQTLSISGTGVAPATLTPTSAAYAVQKVGTTSPARVFTLTNGQTVALTSIVITTTGDFLVSSKTCTTTLAASGSCTVSVVFKPTAVGARTGSLKVTDSASNSPQTSTLSGTGN